MFVFKICTYRFLEGQAFKDSPSYKLKWKYFKKKTKEENAVFSKKPFFAWSRGKRHSYIADFELFWVTTYVVDQGSAFLTKDFFLGSTVEFFFLGGDIYWQFFCILKLISNKGLKKVIILLLPPRECVLPFSILSCLIYIMHANA